MVEVYENLFVGKPEDYERIKFRDDEWRIILAAKEPWHREVLGYKNIGAPKTHPEYLYAVRNHRLILNLIDPLDPRYIPDEIFRVALEWIDENRHKKVLICCNQGRSRSPGIAFAWMRKEGLLDEDFNESINKFKKIYEEFDPSSGILEYLKCKR